MRNLLFIILFFTADIISKAQENQPGAAELLKISETDNFSQLVKLVKRLQYKVVDSSIRENGNLFYLASDFNLVQKSDLSCEKQKNGKISILGFRTFNKALADSFRVYFKRMGYKPSGVSYNKTPGFKETEDFEKNKFYISLAVKEVRKEDQYEFMFLKF